LLFIITLQNSPKVIKSNPQIPEVLGGARSRLVPSKYLPFLAFLELAYSM